MTFKPGLVPEERAQQRAHQELLQTLDATQAHASAQSITSEEADNAIDETMRKIRPRQP